MRRRRYGAVSLGEGRSIKLFLITAGHQVVSIIVMCMLMAHRSAPFRQVRLFTSFSVTKIVHGAHLTRRDRNDRRNARAVGT